MAKIYGNPITLGGGGGQNADLPPLLDNFKASVPVEGIPVKNMPVGTKIKVPVNTDYQSFLGKNITWMVIDHAHTGYPQNYTTLRTEKIIACLSFDAGEPENTDSNRRSNGNNNYFVSNIDSWLNSDKPAGKWWSKSHTYDSAPTIENVSHNPYKDKSGFLAMLNSKFVNIILKTPIKYKQPDVDSGGLVTSNRKVFLLSETELGGTSNGEGYKFSIYTDDESRKHYPTQEAYDNSAYKDSNFATNKPWYVWTRTQDSSNSSYVRRIFIQGNINFNTAKAGTHGIVPVCNISSDTLLNAEPDSDGCYTLAELAPVTIAESDDCSITLSADKMEESRAEQLAGVVWVYGDHSPANVNDGTKIQLTREECVLPEEQPVTFASGKTIGDLELGTKLKVKIKSEYQDFLGEYIPYEIVDKNHAGFPENSVTLGNEKIIALLATDAEENSNTNIHRKNAGNNYYKVSNVLQWLNSSGESGIWYNAQHIYDSAPNKESIVSNQGEFYEQLGYDTKAGFLRMLDDVFVSKLMDTNIECVQPLPDGGQKETVTVKVFQPSLAEIGGTQTDAPEPEGTKFAWYDSNEKWQHPLTDKAKEYYSFLNSVSSADYPNGRFYINLRTCAHQQSTEATGQVNSTFLYYIHPTRNEIGYNTPHAGYINGLLTFCNIPIDMAVSAEPDEDGYYYLLGTEPIEKIVRRSLPWSKTKDFYARQFTYNSKKQYQTMLEGAVASLNKVPEGQPITNLKLKDKIKIGKYNNNVLKWTISNTGADLAISMDGESAIQIGMGAFDSSGSNRYVNSSRHEWLNAKDSMENGFLSQWSEDEINALKNETWIARKANSIGGGTETFEARVVLHSASEIGLSTGDGTLLELFNDVSYRKIGAIWWTRSPQSTTTMNVGYVDGTGALFYLSAGRNAYIRPLCKIAEGVYVSNEPDSDGYYTITGVMK